MGKIVAEETPNLKHFPVTRVYQIFDFCLRSSIALEEIVLAEAPDEGRAIVDVRLEPIPETISGTSTPVYGVQVSGDAVILTVPNIARFLIRGGCEILVEPMGGSDRMVRLYLLGSALGILCHQRGLLPLHANAIMVGDGAYAFAGHSGAGKSTLAAHFARSGHKVLCDDVCAIGFDGAGSPVAWPGLPRLKLWGDASAAFGHDCRLLERVIDGMDKYHVPLPAPLCFKPIPFRRLYLLGRAPEDEAGGIARLQGQKALEAVMAQTYRSFYLDPMGLKGRHFTQCAALARQIEVYAATRTWGFDVFKQEAARLEQHVLEGAEK